MIVSNREQLDLLRLDGRARRQMETQFDVDTEFCKTLRSVVNLTNGDFFTFLPHGIETERAYRFDVGFRDADATPERGGGNLLPVLSLKDYQATGIENFLNSTPHAICIVDDVSARMTDPGIQRKADVVALGDEVCYALTPARTQPDIRRALSFGDYLWHGLVALCAPLREITPASLTEAAILSECLSSTRELHATAYDGEGFIVWRRR